MIKTTNTVKNFSFLKPGGSSRKVIYFRNSWKKAFLTFSWCIDYLTITAIERMRHIVVGLIQVWNFNQNQA